MQHSAEEAHNPVSILLASREVQNSLLVLWSGCCSESSCALLVSVWDGLSSGESASITAQAISTELVV